MKNNHCSKERLVQEIKNLFLEMELPAKGIQAFIFGSFVTEQKERSDIDIGLESEHEISGQVFFQIKDELDELKTLRKFDLVDFAHTSEDFKKLAKKKLIKLT